MKDEKWLGEWSEGDCFPLIPAKGSGGVHVCNQKMMHTEVYYLLREGINDEVEERLNREEWAREGRQEVEVCAHCSLVVCSAVQYCAGHETILVQNSAPH